MRKGLLEDDIAVVGIGCRFPGKTNSPEQFWRLLADGVDAIEDLPAERFDLTELFDGDRTAPGKMYIRRGGFIENIDLFDSAFFGISPREALYIDPQHRLLLEVTYEAFEDAGLSLDRIDQSNTGVFVGISTHDYGEIQRYPGNRAQIGGYSNSGTASSIAANRLSYIFGLRGPSFAVDTACSSALTAAHLACQSLLRGECTMALVAGAQILLTPEPTIGFCKASMLSPDGECRAFDASANGYVRSEGVGVVVLKPLSVALAEGDEVYAVIRGTAINQDGRTNGMTVPSAQAQAAMLRDALEQAGIAPADVDYVEAHGTGTQVGDPIEASVLGEVLGSGRGDRPACVIGSVKTNIGHLEAASGIAGLIKVILALHHRQIPPSLHFHQPNPAIDFDGLKLRVPTSLEAWPQTDRPAVAGLNSFGFGGANAHLVLQEAPAAKPRAAVSSEGAAELLAISARSEDALLAVAVAYRDFLASHPEVSLANVCATAALRRTHHVHRATVTGSSREEMMEGLDSIAAREAFAGASTGRASATETSKIAFVFTGMGPQWWAMGRELMREELVYREASERCDAALQPHTGWSIVELLQADEVSSRMADADVAQVANFVLQTALAELLRSWGIVPDAVIGHSAGSIAAMHVAGVYDLADTALLAHHRARLQNQTAGQGTMLAVGLPEADALQLVEADAQRLSLAAVNSPSNCTLAGDADALEAIRLTLEERNVFARMLPVTIPYHSVKMDPLREELLACLQPLKPHTASICLMSDIAGGWADGAECDGAYWWQNVRGTVRFGDGIVALIEEGFRTFIEIGPHPVLSVAIKECLSARGMKGDVLPSLRKQENNRAAMLRLLGSLWVRGRTVDWSTVSSHFDKAVKLPAYPWQRERHWFEPEPANTGPAFAPTGRASHPLLGNRLAAPAPQWSVTIRPAVRQWLDDHVVQGTAVFPAAAYVEMALAAADPVASGGTIALRDLHFSKALFLRPGTQPVLQTAIDAGRQLAVHSMSMSAEGDWTRHFHCRIETPGRPAANIAIDAIRERSSGELSAATCYKTLAERGLAYGHCFQGIDRIWQGEGEALAHLDIAAKDVDPKPYSIHPSLLDAAFQVLIAATGIGDPHSKRGGLMLPVGIDSLTLHRSPGADAWCHARLVSHDVAMLVGDIDLVDGVGTALLEIRGLRCKSLEAETSKSDDLVDCLYEFQWEPMPDEAAPRLVAHAARRAVDLEAAVDDRSTHSGWQRYYEFVEPRMEELAGQLAANTLRTLGWGRPVGDTLLASQILEDPRIVPSAHKLTLCLFAILTEQGVLSVVPGGWLFHSALPDSDLGQIKSELLRSDPAFDKDVDLILHCGGMLPAILRGDVNAGEVLFGPVGRHLVAKFYLDGPGSSFYGKLLADTIAHVVAKSPADRPIRILEVGAGTGGATAHLLATLPADRIEYIYTDVSPLFTARAVERFGTGRSFTTGLFDVERDPAAQGLALHSVDIVIAANVLHGTAELAHTLANIRPLLAPGGVLALLEITRRRRWPDIIFGITEGWWRFSDHDLRPAHPLLEPEEWKSLLLSSGFADVALITDRNHAGEPAQTVVLAETTDAADPAQLAAQSWLILGDRGDTGARLAEALTRMGGTATLSHTLEGDLKVYRGIVLLSALDAPEAATMDGDEIVDAQRLVCDRSLEVLAALRSAALTSPPVLYLVTGNAQSAGETARRSIVQSPLWGLARGANREQYEVKCRLADLDEVRSDQAVFALAREILGDHAEEEIAFRGPDRWVHRLRRIAPEAQQARGIRRAPEAGEGWRVEVATPGALSTIGAVAKTRREPGPDEVEVKVVAAALNFRDIMLASCMMPAEAAQDSLGGDGLGLDYAGIVTRCGSAVSGFAPGDEVMGIARNALASFVTTKASLVARKPSGLAFTTASAIPCAFATAHYALDNLARLAKGEFVLIHAATGGVGLAAIQVAQRVGAEIIATAGSPDKRSYLESLGIRHILDSRTLAFADAVMELTGGQGVDVILNSLAGEAITKGLGILKPYGRFVEIGKRDIYADSRIGLHPFRKNISFFAVDLDRMCHERPEMAGAILREVLDCFERGEYRAIPQHVFGMSELEASVRMMAQAKHIGKIVIEMTDPQLEIAVPRTVLRDDASYLVTGGLRGFGLATVRWLVRQGARSVVVIGRSEPSAEVAAEFASLAGQGIHVEAVRGDVASAADVKRVITSLRATMPPLRGVLHCATVYADAPLADMTPERMRNGLSPKIAGGWNLHCETLADELDFFVLYSSMASVLGNPMQINYCAANEFLDALARYRRANSLQALTVHWGILGDAGYVAETSDLAEYLARQGYGSIAADEALFTLDKLLKHDRTSATVARIDWQRLAAYFPSMVGSTSFRSFAPAEDSNADAGSQSIRTALAQAPDEETRTNTIRQFLIEKVGRILGIGAKKLDPEETLTNMGLDSISAVELVTVLNLELHYELPVVKILQGISIRELGEMILATLPPIDASRPGMIAVPTPASKPEAAVGRQIDREMPRPAVYSNGNSSKAASTSGTAPQVQTSLSIRDWSPSQKVARYCTSRFLDVATSVTVEGLDRFPPSGAFILASNHLSWSDMPVLLAKLPRPVTVMTAEWLEQSALTKWLASAMGNAIFVRRGEGDLKALENGVSALLSGEVLAVSPEGTRSKSGGLQQAYTGAAYLASRARVPVVPLALWGHEDLAGPWRSMRRPDIQIRVGEPLDVPAGEASAADLRRHTDRIMFALAELLPASYRGVYSAQTGNEL